MLRSIGRGWVLEDIDLKQIPQSVVTEAINAVEVTGLDLGAVSVTFDETFARVTNITTGPSLSESMLTAYTEAIQNFVDSKPKARTKRENIQDEKPSPELIARLTRRLREATSQDVEKLLEIFD